MLLLSSVAIGEEKNFTNNVGMRFIYIPSGTFLMGAKKKFNDAVVKETPQHKVTISRSFFISEHEVTQGMWKTVMGNNPAFFRNGDHFPIEKISWLEALDFIEKLNKLEGFSCSRKLNFQKRCYRLPTEAEWEYVARAGTTTRWSCGNNKSCLLDQAWYNINSNDSTHPVKLKSPNQWGVYDMQGNVAEFVWDFWGDYPNRHVTDPIGPSSSIYGIIRGGSYRHNASYLRSAYRGISSNLSYASVGFRIVKMP